METLGDRARPRDCSEIALSFAGSREQRRGCACCLMVVAQAPTVTRSGVECAEVLVKLCGILHGSSKEAKISATTSLATSLCHSGHCASRGLAT